MKAIILAAGESRRLYPHTKNKPKCLLKIGKRSIIEHQITSFRKCGIKDIVVVTGHGKERVEKALGKGIKYIYNSKYKETSSIYSLWLAKEEASSGFVVINSDVFFHIDILKKLLNSKKQDCITLDPNSTLGDEEMKVKVNDGKVVDMSKDMAISEAHGENVGMIKFSRKGAKVLFSKIEELISSGIVNVWAPYAFKEIAKSHNLYVVSTHGLPWIEIDFLEDLKRAREKIYPEIIKRKVL